MGRRQCELDGCTKWVQAGGTPHCKAHGGGKRCQEEGCTMSAATGGAHRCKAHGGGKRCQEEGCFRSAQGGTGACIAHGGGKRCQEASQLAAASPTSRMAGAATSRAAPSLRNLVRKVVCCTASRTVAARRATRRAARPPKYSARISARRTEAVPGARRPVASPRRRQGARPAAGHTGGASGARVWVSRAGSANNVRYAEGAAADVVQAPQPGAHRSRAVEGECKEVLAAATVQPPNCSTRCAQRV
jgi:hypothetical protein